MSQTRFRRFYIMTDITSYAYDMSSRSHDLQRSNYESDWHGFIPNINNVDQNVNPEPPAEMSFAAHLLRQDISSNTQLFRSFSDADVTSLHRDNACQGNLNSYTLN